MNDPAPHWSSFISGEIGFGPVVSATAADAAIGLAVVVIISDGIVVSVVSDDTQRRLTKLPPRRWRLHVACQLLEFAVAKVGGGCELKYGSGVLEQDEYNESDKGESLSKGNSQNIVVRTIPAASG